VGAFRAEGGGNAAGHEPLDPPVSDDEARACGQGPESNRRFEVLPPVPIGWHLVAPRQSPVGTRYSIGAAAGPIGPPPQRF
jgi:hypothetical protein